MFVAMFLVFYKVVHVGLESGLSARIPSKRRSLRYRNGRHLWRQTCYLGKYLSRVARRKTAYIHLPQFIKFTIIKDGIVFNANH